MCLAVPGKVVEIKGKKAIIDYSGEKREADCSLMKVKVGDYVIVNNKLIIQVISKEEYDNSTKLI